MTSGGNDFNYFPENQLTKFSARVSKCDIFINKCNFTYLLITSWFMKILLVVRKEIWEILVMRRVNGRWLQNKVVKTVVYQNQ